MTSSGFSIVRTLAILISITVAMLAPSPIMASDRTAPIRSLTIKAKPVSNRKVSVSNWETSWGSYDKDQYRTQKIQYEVRNFSKLPAPNVEVWTIWVSKDTKFKLQSIYGIEIKKYHIQPGETISQEVSSPPLEMNRTKFYGENVRREGETPDGYLVLIKYNNNQGECYSSNSGMKNLINNKKEFDKLVKEYFDIEKSLTR